jgi:DNA-binding IclR family transcriptional regulator
MPRNASPPPTTSLRQRVQSVEVGVEVLNALAALGGSASLSAVAGQLGESAAKVHRYMASFVETGLVAQNPRTQQYHLGLGAVRIGLAALRQCDPLRLGEPALAALRELRVTSFMAVLGNKGPTILRIEEPALPVTINVRAGSVLPWLFSATGRVFLAYCGDIDPRRRAAAELAGATREQRAAVPNQAAVAALRQAVRERGYATIEDTLLRGVSAVSAPVFDHAGNLAAALTALWASGALDARQEERIRRRVASEAAGLSVLMGREAEAASHREGG